MLSTSGNRNLFVIQGQYGYNPVGYLPTVPASEFAAIVSDSVNGNAYIVGPGYVTCFSFNDWRIHWQFEFWTGGGNITATPVLSANNSGLIVADMDGNVWMLSTATGGWLWYIQLTPGAPLLSSPILDSNGTLYIGAECSGGGCVFGIKTTTPIGAIWSFTLPTPYGVAVGPLQGGLALDSSGILYVSTLQGTVMAIWDGVPRDSLRSTCPKIPAGTCTMTSLTSWPQYMQNSEHTGNVPWVGPVGSMSLRWLSKLASQVVASSGGSTASGTDDVYSSYYHNGPGNTNVNDAVTSTAILGRYNRVYYGASDGYLYSLSQVTGNILWSYNLISIFASPALNDDANMLFAVSAGDGTLRCFDALAGHILWSYQLGYYVSGSFFFFGPVLDSSSVYAVSETGDVFALNQSTGGLVWSTQIGSGQLVDLYGTGQTGPVIVGSPTLYGNSLYLTVCGHALWCMFARFRCR